MYLYAAVSVQHVDGDILESLLKQLGSLRVIGDAGYCKAGVHRRRTRHLRQNDSQCSLFRTTD